MPSVPDRRAITPQLAASGVVAILRGSTDRHLQGVSRTLGEAGVTCLELTLTTPGAVDALARVRGEVRKSRAGDASAGAALPFPSTTVTRSPAFRCSSRSRCTRPS